MVGPRIGEIYVLLARAGENAHDLALLVERRVCEWPSGPSQEEVKDLEHEGDRITADLLGRTNVMFGMMLDRDDLVELALVVDDVTDSIENASELFGLYGVESTTKQSHELCALLVRATAELIRELLVEVVEGHDALAVADCWKAMVDAVRNVGRSGVASMGISAVARTSSAQSANDCSVGVSTP